MCVQVYVCICLCVFEKEEKDTEDETDQMGARQTAEELRWKTDLIATVMLH